MGLLKNKLELDNGLVVKNAYFRVDSLSYDGVNSQVTVTSYVSRDIFLQGKSFINAESFTFNLDISDEAPNFIRQVYAHLKSLDGYIDAEDVLEEGQTPIPVYT